MSFSVTKNCGLGVMLFILVSVVIFANEQNQQSLAVLRHHVDVDMPALAHFEEVETELRSIHHSLRVHRTESIEGSIEADMLIARLSEFIGSLHKQPAETADNFHSGRDSQGHGHEHPTGDSTAHPDRPPAEPPLPRLVVAMETYRQVVAAQALTRAGLVAGSPGHDWVRAWSDVETAMADVKSEMRASSHRTQRLIVQAAESRRTQFLVLAGYGLVLAMGVSLMLSRILTARVRWLSDGLNRLAAGELTFRLTTRSRDEFAELAYGVNAMAEALEDKVESLRRSESRFRGLIENSVLGIVIQRNHEILFTNRAFATTLGFDSVDELISSSSSLEDHIAPHERERLRRYQTARLAAEPAPDRYEYEGLKKNALVATFRNSVQLIDWQGEPAVQSVITDISQSKRAELALAQSRERMRRANEDLEARVEARTRELEVEKEAIRQSEERFRDLTSLLSDWYWEQDKDLCFVNVSNNRGAGAGVTPDQHIGKKRWELPCHGVTDAQWRAHKAQLAAREAFHGFEFQRANERGDIREISVSGKPVFDVHGAFLGYRGVAHDITDRKRSEVALRDSEASLAQAQRLARVGSWRWSLSKDVMIDCSQEFARIHGMTTDRVLSLLNIHSDGLIHPEDRLRVEDFFDRAHGEQRDYAIDYRIVRPDGAVRFVRELGEVVRDEDGKPVEHRGTLQDITEQKQIEEQFRLAKETSDAANKAKSEFLANMSHEIRTPINGVLGMTELLLNSELDTDQRRYAVTVSQCGEALLGVINDILDFSKIEAGKLELVESTFSLPEVVEDVADMFAQAAQRKGLELVTHIPARLPTTCRGDVGRLRQILINLVSNAVKFTASGEVVVRVSEAAAQNRVPRLRFEVTDTGIGIHAASQPQVFESFMQVDASSSRTYEGSGLGLAISARLVDLLGGEIGLQSTPGAGSTFWFDIALSHDPASTETTNNANDAIRGTRVLVVDDNQSCQQAVCAHLQAWQAETLTANDAEQALRILARASDEGRPVTLALIDLHLADASGLDLAKAIGSGDASRAPAIILMSSVLGLPDRKAATGMGVVGHLTKPVRGSRLHAVLAAQLDDSSTQASSERETTTPTQLHSPRNRRILVAEDHPVNQQLMREMLQLNGCEVTVVENGREAVHAMQHSDRFDLILMDCQMPDLDGFEATRQIRALDTEYARGTPIVAVTANAMTGDRDCCLSAGMDDYLSKPVALARLGNILDQWLPREDRPTDGVDAVLDRDVIESILAMDDGGATGFLRTLYDQFVGSAAVDIERLQQAISDDQPGQVRDHAHHLKSSSASLGAGNLAVLCQTLEDMARQGTLDDALRLLTEVSHEYKRVSAALAIEFKEVA